MTYAGLSNVSAAHDPDLGGNIEHGDPFSYAPSLWRYLIERFGASSILDVGAGQGHAARFFYNAGCITYATEGLIENVERSIFPLIHHDLRKSGFSVKVDIVYCNEVVEHVDEKYVENVMSTLTCGKIAAITHALPGQRGYHHVNCQPPEYWIKKFEERGFAHIIEDTNRARKLAERDGASHFARSGLVFGKST